MRACVVDAGSLGGGGLLGVFRHIGQPGAEVIDVSPLPLDAAVEYPHPQRELVGVVAGAGVLDGPVPPENLEHRLAS